MKRKQNVYYKHFGGRGSKHPHIRIAAQYLKRFDFNVGDIIEVDIGSGQIIIKKCSVVPPNQNQTWYIFIRFFCFP